MFRIASFYAFVTFPTYRAAHSSLEETCIDNDVLGTILLAPEGINGTIAGSEAALDAVLDAIRSIPGFEHLEAKFADAAEPPFLKLKVRIKKEIVSLGVGPVDASNHTAVKVPPSEWNDLISQPDVILIDTRNDYEHAIGTFEGAVNPATQSFTDFPAWIDAHGEVKASPRIAMFCTGGIRCEKASAWLKEHGFDEVYQLEGGILRYLETVPEDQSSWNGECYVFDRRVSVGHGLVPGDREICVNCDRVLSSEDRAEEGYAKGVCCGACHTTITEDRRARFAERQHQIELAAERGSNHLGSQRETV